MRGPCSISVNTPPLLLSLTAWHLVSMCGPLPRVCVNFIFILFPLSLLCLAPLGWLLRVHICVRVCEVWSRAHACRGLSSQFVLLVHNAAGLLVLGESHQPSPPKEIAAVLCIHMLGFPHRHCTGTWTHTQPACHCTGTVYLLFRMHRPHHYSRPHADAQSHSRSRACVRERLTDRVSEEEGK